MTTITPGVRLRLRGEDFLVTKCEKNLIDVEGISELVQNMRFQFDLRLEEYDVLKPENTEFQTDESPNYRQTKLYLETVFRNSSHFSDHIEIAHKAAIRGANFQFIPTIKALSLPQPRMLIADGVGLGKTVQVGIFMSELIRRGKGKKVLVITPKSILAQFQQEIWSRFAIPLVRLDSQGIARIKEKIPANKNPFDYYDKVIVSVDTLKNNAKFRHNLEKVRWDIVAIDECHTVANIKSQRGNLAKFISERTEALVLTSATPHNGKKENFANLIGMLDPTAIPYHGDFTKEDIDPLYVRRFKKDVEDEVGDAFKDRDTKKITCKLSDDEETVLRIINDFKKRTYEEADGDMTYGTLLFSVGLFKSYMSSPKACLETVKNRLDKNVDDDEVTELLQELKDLLKKIIKEEQDSKLNTLIRKLKKEGWSGRKKDDRIIIFSERRPTLNYLEKKFSEEFNLKTKKEVDGEIDRVEIIQFHGTLTDTQQQEILENFSKEDSKIRVFLASDAGSQGVNLHYYCHKMYNYDIPWSIITLDQRNGRIDRFGQTETPLIYYLISESTSDDVQGDIRILEKLKEKEEEVHKSLGDAGNVWKLFDVGEEEKVTTKAIASSDGSVMEQEEDKADWLDIFSGLGDDGAPTKTEIRKDNGFNSFYASDFEYYTTLIEELKSKDEKLNHDFLLEHEDQTIEVVQTDDLSEDGVLFDIPGEAFPKKKETFKLTTDSKLVEQSIVLSRKKQKEWPSHQLLYDLNPIAKWMQHKLLAQVDRGSALVSRMRHPLPENSAWYVFQGITSNGQGKPIFSKTFVVGRSLNGQSVGSLESFSDFMNEFRLKDTIPTLEVSENHLARIKALLPDAVDSATKMYTMKLQGDLDDEMSQKLEYYEEKLNNWLQASERQLEIQFGEEDKGPQSYHKNKRRKEVNYVREQMERFYNAYFQLENEPFLRLLAVFFNA